MIQFNNVVKRFGARTVLNGISFYADEGEILFILGTSGTGKSVSLKLIVGLLDADEGEIWVGGENVTRFDEQRRFAVRKRCGMVFQQPALFDGLSVFENVAFGLRRHYSLSSAEIAARVRMGLSLVNLRGIEAKMPSQISYGMQKRVSMARTIALEPKALLFDEPTTGLDPVTTTAVNRLILDLSRALKTTSIVVSHDMRCALEIADRIVVLDQGQVIEEGTPDRLRRSTVPLVRDFLAEALAT
jgi:phospholipid/cholesterol/gamma-HCH transport system ATP-binding protein